MYGISQSEAKIMKDLVKELNEFNTYVKNGLSPFSRGVIQGNYYNAFNPVVSDSEQYKTSIRLRKSINDVLNDNCINIKSQGYTYIKDALCIIIDRQSLDICLESDVYPYIAEKYKVKKISKVEHNIRNALASGYKMCTSKYPDRDCIMNRLESKPTNKKFLLRAVQEMNEKLLKESVYD